MKTNNFNQERGHFLLHMSNVSDNTMLGSELPRQDKEVQVSSKLHLGHLEMEQSDKTT